MRGGLFDKNCNKQRVAFYCEYADIIKQISKKLNLSVSFVCNKLIASALKDPTTIAGLEKEAVEIVASKNVDAVRRANLKKISRMHILNNFYRRLQRLVLPKYFKLGVVNMDVVRELVNATVAEFNAYTDDDKRMLASEIKEIRKHRSETYCLNTLQHLYAVRAFMKKIKSATPVPEIEFSK